MKIKSKTEYICKDENKKNKKFTITKEQKVIYLQD